MVFSYTAPFIDEREEEEERQALSQREREDIRDRMYGDFVLNESRNDMDQAPILLQESLDAIPDDEKTDYLEAMERVPELVEAECKPLVFMRAAKYDAWTAARRLVEYWKIRRLVFGETRAFMRMTTDGAIASDLVTLQLGIFQRLPNDEHGRPVLFMDRIRCIPSIAPREAIIRVFFYFLHLISQEQAGQKKGCVLVVNMEGFDIYKHFDRILTKKLCKIMRDCIPTTVCSLHLCCGPSQLVVDLVMPVVKHIAGKYLRMHMLLHSGSDLDIFEELQTYGLERKNLAHILGGEFSQQDFENWLAES